MSRQSLSIFVILAMILVYWSCAKSRTVVVPQACMTLSARTLHLTDTLTVTDCSTGADQSLVAFTDSTIPNPSTYPYGLSCVQFDRNRMIRHVFPYKGKFHVFLRVSNNSGGPIQSDTLSVRVLP